MHPSLNLLGFPNQIDRESLFASPEPATTMKKRPFSLTHFAFATLLSAGTSHAATVSVTDGDGNLYGNTDGFALDFDSTTGLAADWTPDLTAGGVYSIDSISLFDRNSFDADFYLGVYTGLTGSTLSGFQGTSFNTVNFSAQGNEMVTWTFSGITVVPETNPAAGNDIRFFILQSGTEPLATAPNIGDNNTQIKRIDGEGGSFATHLSAIIDAGGSGLGTSRSPEYEASLTLIPEPGSLGIATLGLALGTLVRRRRH